MTIIILVLIAIAVGKWLFDTTKDIPVVKTILRWVVSIGIVWWLTSAYSFGTAIGVIVIFTLVGIVLNLFK